MGEGGERESRRGRVSGSGNGELRVGGLRLRFWMKRRQGGLGVVGWWDVTMATD